MLTIPKDSPSIVSIVGIDPGSETLGVGVLWIDINTMRIVGAEAKTYVGSKLAGKNSWIEAMYGARFSRVHAHEENLLTVLREVQPLFIASESPFMSARRPQAYGALTEVVSAIRSAVMRYDIWRTLTMVDPPSVKMAVGAAGNAQKEAVKLAVMRLPDLVYTGRVALEYLDEHSIDALAVAYSRYKQLLEEVCPPHLSLR